MTLSNISQSINDAFSSMKNHATHTYEHASTAVGNLGSHMVSQFDNFQKFAATPSSDEKMAQIFLRTVTAGVAGSVLHETLKILGSSAMSLLRGRIFACLGFGILVVPAILTTCLFASLALDPQGLVRALKSTLKVKE